jgi:hypothetical protein
MCLFYLLLILSLLFAEELSDKSYKEVLEQDDKKQKLKYFMRHNGHLLAG